MPYAIPIQGQVWEREARSAVAHMACLSGRESCPTAAKLLSDASGAAGALLESVAARLPSLSVVELLGDMLAASSRAAALCGGIHSLRKTQNRLRYRMSYLQQMVGDVGDRQWSDQAIWRVSELVFRMSGDIVRTARTLSSILGRPGPDDAGVLVRWSAGLRDDVMPTAARLGYAIRSDLASATGRPVCGCKSGDPHDDGCPRAQMAETVMGSCRRGSDSVWIQEWPPGQASPVRGADSGYVCLMVEGRPYLPSTVGPVTPRAHGEAVGTVHMVQDVQLALSRAMAGDPWARLTAAGRLIRVAAGPRAAAAARVIADEASQ